MAHHNKIIISVTNSISYDKRMLKTAQSLLEAGCEVTIIGVERGMANDINVQGLTVKRMKLWCMQGIGFYIEYQLRLLWQLIIARYDVHLAADLDTVLPHIIIGKMRGARVVLDSHELFAYVPEVYNRPFVRWVWNSIEQIAMNTCDQIYTVSQSIAEYWDNRYGRRCAVVYNYPQRSVISRVSDDDQDRTIVYLGDLNIGRGLLPLIEAIADLDIKLVILGEGVMRQPIEALIRDLQCEHLVYLVGAVLPQDIPAYLMRASIGVNLLEDMGMNYYYSAANKFFDYVQAHLPVLSMNYPEYAKHLEQFEVGVLIDRADRISIARAIRQMINDTEQLKYYHNQCIEAAKVWTWESQSDMLTKIIVPSV